METTLPHTIDQFHQDVKVWKSNVALASDEIQFIENLTHSYIFEPSSPDLFERLEQFKSEVASVEVLLKSIQTLLVKHDAELSGMLECDTVSCDMFFQEKHLVIKEQYRQFIDSYNKTKIEIFNYCGNILKSKKN